jgi:hypothetical protein
MYLLMPRAGLGTYKDSLVIKQGIVLSDFYINKKGLVTLCMAQ